MQNKKNSFQVGVKNITKRKVVDINQSFHVGSGVVPFDRVGWISYGHCFYHASPFCSITCIVFHQSFFLHLILYLLFPRLFQSSSTTAPSNFKANFNFQMYDPMKNKKMVDSVLKNHKPFFINISNYRDISVQIRQLLPILGL